MSDSTIRDQAHSEFFVSTRPRSTDADIKARRRIVLCVDDDPVVLSLQRFLLEAAGFAVLTASDSTEALRLFVFECPDAVVLDQAMPGIDGSAVAAKMRRLRAEVPLILNSGSAQIPATEAQLFDRLLLKGTAAQLLTGVLREMFPAPDGGVSPLWGNALCVEAASASAKSEFPI
jgi:CheY-like chemotaxis protein